MRCYLADKEIYLKDAYACSSPVTDEWIHTYSRQKAAYPLAWYVLRNSGRQLAKVDNADGDRNLICSCCPIEVYVTEEQT